MGRGFFGAMTVLLEVNWFSDWQDLLKSKNKILPTTSASKVPFGVTIAEITLPAYPTPSSKSLPSFQDASALLDHTNVYTYRCSAAQRSSLIRAREPGVDL